VVRLSGSPVPPWPAVLKERIPLLRLSGLQAGATLKRGSLVQVVSSDPDRLARISRVEFFVDGKPYSYALASPFRLGNSDNWDMHGIEGGRHLLRIVIYERWTRSSRLIPSASTPMRSMTCSPAVPAGLSRSLLMEWRPGMESNLRLYY
jgi:hypothetical protein